MKSLRIVFVLCATFTLLSACGGANAPAPAASTLSVQILAPAYGASFNEGETVSVQSNATDANGVMRVELYVDGQLANTKLAGNPQGESQFSVTQEWVATTPGAHTLVVRAFNTANAAGEATVAIAVNPRVAAQPTTATENTPVADASPTAQGDNPTAVAPTEILPTDAPPTAVPPTAVPPTRKATLPPVVFQPPFDGGMSVNVSWVGNGLQIEAEANDTVVGQENGDGIAYIEFFIQDLNGNVIASKRENNKPYCFFSEANGECEQPDENSGDFRWREGRPIRAGWYFIRAVAHTPDNRIQVAERALRITLPVDTFENFFVNIIEPSTDRPEKELVFQAEVVGGAAEAGVDHVDMFVVAYDGKIVHKRTEANPNYCGFSGGDNNTPCPPYNFAANGLKWTSGAPVNPTQYVLRAVAYGRDGQMVATTSVIQIDVVQ